MALTKAEKAVAVAKDVLAQLRKPNCGGMKVANDGSYFATDFYLTDEDYKKDLQDILPKVLEEGCTVCARGAALISKARLFDKVPVIKITGDTWWNSGGIYVDQDDTAELLKGVFSKKTLHAIECAFEQDPCMDHSLPCEYGAALFGRRYDDPVKRLAAIMRNIVKNNGEFVVKKVTEEEYNAKLGRYSKV
jgi:hypothetical protein